MNVNIALNRSETNNSSIQRVVISSTSFSGVASSSSSRITGSMKLMFHGIEKLSGVENWCTWKFAVRNLLLGTENAYEVCIGEISKPEPLTTGASEAQRATYSSALKAWDKADRAASQVFVRTLEAKVMALLVSCDSARDMWVKLHAIFEQKTK